MELPDPSFANEFNVPQEDAIFIFDLRRATVSLPFQVHLFKVLAEVGLVAFSSACFEFADEVPKEAQHDSLAHLPKVFFQPSSRPFEGCCCGVLRVGASLPPLSVAMLRLFQVPHRALRTNPALRAGASILPVVTKGLPISPRFTPYVFLSRCKFSNLTIRQTMVEFYLLTFPRFPLRKGEHRSYLDKNRTHDFRACRCSGYLLDHSSDERQMIYLTTLAIHNVYQVLVLHCITPLIAEYEGVSTCTARMYSSSTFYVQNPALEIVHQQKSVKVYLYMYSGNVQRKTLYAQHPVSLRIFTSLPGSRLRFFITMQIQYSYEDTFVQQ